MRIVAPWIAPLVVGCWVVNVANADTLGMAKPLRLVSVDADRCEAPVHSLITLSVGLEATYENPFDSGQVRVDAHVAGVPAGVSWVVPGFLYQPYARGLDDGKEKLHAIGEPIWQVRLSLPKPGQYDVTVTAANASKSVTSQTLQLKVEPADVPGMVRRHASDHRYFVTDNGETFYLIGANVCWGSQRGTFSYDEWLPKYAGAGCNWLRVWLSPSWTTFGMNTGETGFDRIDLGNAWRLDHVLGMCEGLDLRVMLCIDSFNILRSTKKEYGAWEQSVYNKANGGPLSEPRDYFTSETMLDAYRDRLRYLVARYGYSPNVFAWEFWNEVDIVDQYDTEVVAAWHRDMAHYLRSIDPWTHLIGTSHSRTPGDPQVDVLPELEFVQTHHYGGRDIARALGEDHRRKAAAVDRPHFHGEFGITPVGGTRKADPTGIHLHNGLYSSVGQMQAGTPMTWWWDSYVEPCNLYPVYAAFSRWVDSFDFVNQGAVPVDADIVYLDGDLPRMPEDDWIRPTHAAWAPAEFNEPMTIRIARDGHVAHDVPVSRLLHGVRNHPDLHNPVTFKLDVPKGARFGVVVEGVSGYGGAALQISLDGDVVRREDFPDPDALGNTATLTKYNKIYYVDLPRGRHTVIVENTGNDWFYVSYKASWLSVSPLRVWGVHGRTAGLVWVQNRLHTWKNATGEDYESCPIEGARLLLKGFAEGTWRVETWDTVEGKVTGSAMTSVGDDGMLELALPPISWDAAFRIRCDGK